MKFIEMKNITCEIRNSLNCLNRLDMQKKRLVNLKTTIKTIQTKAQTEKDLEKINRNSMTYGTILSGLIE